MSLPYLIFGSFISFSSHEKATEAQYLEGIQTRFGVVFISEFSGGVLFLTSVICGLLVSAKQE